jgi:hypothetical protein
MKIQNYKKLLHKFILNQCNVEEVMNAYYRKQPHY